MWGWNRAEHGDTTPNAAEQDELNPDPRLVSFEMPIRYMDGI